MKTGRPRKPDTLKEAEGNPGKRRLGGLDSKLDPATPRMPIWLTPFAKKVWRNLVPRLAKLGVLRAPDAELLGCLCDSLAMHSLAVGRLSKQMQDFQKGRTKDGKSKNPADALMIQYPSGAIGPNPVLAIINREKINIAKFGAEFGLSPTARARLLLEDQFSGEESYEDKLSAARPQDYDEDDELTIQ